MWRVDSTAGGRVLANGSAPQAISSAAGIPHLQMPYKTRTCKCLKKQGPANSLPVPDYHWLLCTTGIRECGGRPWESMLRNSACPKNQHGPEHFLPVGKGGGVMHNTCSAPGYLECGEGTPRGACCAGPQFRFTTPSTSKVSHPGNTPKVMGIGGCGMMLFCGTKHC